MLNIMSEYTNLMITFCGVVINSTDTPGLAVIGSQLLLIGSSLDKT